MAIWVRAEGRRLKGDDEGRWMMAGVSLWDGSGECPCGQWIVEGLVCTDGAGNDTAVGTSGQTVDVLYIF